MKKRIAMIALSLALMAGMISVQMPEAIAAETENTEQAFENIDYEKSPDTRVILDGDQIAFDVYPRIVSGRTLVPMRTMFETFGLTVSWDNSTRTAQGTDPDNTISFTIDSNKALVNGQEIILDIPASIIDGRTMIPLRFLSENLGYKVVWIQASNLILISKSDIIEWRYAGYEGSAPYPEFEAKYINGVKTAETRYTGINHDVKIYTLYSADGRLIPNVPDFKIANYGTGWYKQSPFVGKVYWVDADIVTGMYGNSKFFDASDFRQIKVDMLEEGTTAGNYIKIKIDEHVFDLDIWNEIAFDDGSGLSLVQDEKLLDGQIINSYDTAFKVTINDKHSGLMTMDAFLGYLLDPKNNQAYNVLEKDPKTMFTWDDNTWKRLKGETPWTGMTKDMFLVQRQSNPDKMTQLETKFSKLELWVYESDYADSVYYFDDGILTTIW